MSASGPTIQPTFVPVTSTRTSFNSLLHTNTPSIINIGVNNNTLYVQNLNEKASIKMLKYDLHRIFSRYGVIESIVAKRNIKMRGQAFIIFSDTYSSKKALDALQGKPLYGKPMVIRYAKFKSDIISRRDGTYEEERRKIMQDKQNCADLVKQVQMKKNPFQSLLTGGVSDSAANIKPTAATGMQVINRTLFVQGISSSISEDQLSSFFNKFNGFVEIRKVPSRSDIAFVDYETENQAFFAREGTNGLEGIEVFFAKK